MPFVRIDLPPATTAEEARAISDGVHQALVATFNVPADDRFQVVARQPEGAIVCAPEYLGVKHSSRVAMVQIDCAPGRTVEMKQALYAAVAAAVAGASSIAAADVIIHLVETVRENWSFGNGVAHYVVQAR